MICLFDPKIDKSKCIGCGACVNVCPVKVYELKNGKAHPSFPEKCIGCKACESVCPVKAIKVEEKK